MRAQRAPLRPTFSSARLCHVVHVALLYFTEEWGPAEDPKHPSLNSTPACLKVIDTFRFGQKRAQAILVGNYIFFLNRRVQIATLAVHHRLPAIYPWRESAEAGGLMS